MHNNCENEVKMTIMNYPYTHIHTFSVFVLKGEILIILFLHIVVTYVGCRYMIVR